jgi:hypothetical protein
VIAEAILLGSVAAISAGLAAANRHFSARRVFDRHKLLPIGDAKDGAVVRVRGLVRPGGGDLLSAPLSGRPCVAWTLHVSQEHGRGDMANYIRVLDERIIRPFFVDDEHDTAFVTPEESSLALIEDCTFDSRTDKVVPALEAHLAARGVDMLTGANYVVREAILSVGEPVTVVGRGSWESDPSRPGEGYRSVGRRLVIATGPKGVVHVSDDPSLTQQTKKP